MVEKVIDTLVADIKALFDNGHDPAAKHIYEFGKDVAETVGVRLLEHQQERPIQNLRMSNLGKPDRQLWYDTHRVPDEVLSADTKIKFMFGDILEHFLIFLAEAAGHTVTDRQRRVELDGVEGSIDCFIDGVLVDVKSASSRSFTKFKDGSLVFDDPFGYISQLSGYSCALGYPDGAFLVIDKQLGHICLMQIPSHELKAQNIERRVVQAKEVVNSDVVPDRCYELKEEGKSGNLVLPVGCSYCSHKKFCYQDENDGFGLRVFAYASGPKFFAKVVKEPLVQAISF